MTVYDTHRKRNLYADITTEELIELRKGRCEAGGPGCIRQGSQAHHGLIRRDKRKAKWLDVLINKQLVCYVCHTETGYADSAENHIAFYQMQCERYGSGTVEHWIADLPYKIPPDVQRG